jgi:hypothetical protein
MWKGFVLSVKRSCTFRPGFQLCSRETEQRAVRTHLFELIADGLWAFLRPVAYKTHGPIGSKPSRPKAGLIPPNSVFLGPNRSAKQAEHSPDFLLFW